LYVVFELGERHLRAVLCGGGVGGFGVFGNELIEDFGEKLMGDKLGVFEIGNYDAANAF
jgi:hypothetical protein